MAVAAKMRCKGDLENALALTRICASLNSKKEVEGSKIWSGNRNSSPQVLKFVFSEKATKNDKIFTVDLTLTT